MVYEEQFEISVDEIKQKMMQNYNPSSKAVDRTLFITPIRNNYSKIGTVVFSLDGSPPKGYALYIPGIPDQLHFYDHLGERWK